MSKKNPLRRRQVSDLLGTAQRRAFVLDRRRAGETYAVIVAAAIKEFGRDQLPRGWDKLYAAKDMKRELVLLRRECNEDAMVIRDLESTRVDRVLSAIWEDVIKGDLPSIDRFINLVKLRMKLWGLGTPDTQVAIRVKDGSAEIVLLSDGERRIRIIDLFAQVQNRASMGDGVPELPESIPDPSIISGEFVTITNPNMDPDCGSDRCDTG